MPESSQNEGQVQSRDKDIHMIEIKVDHSTSMESIEEEISAKLRGEEVKEMLCTPGDEVVIRLLSEGP
jgi:hypothetical protein